MKLTLSNNNYDCYMPIFSKYFKMSSECLIIIKVQKYNKYLQPAAPVESPQIVPSEVTAPLSSKYYTLYEYEKIKQKKELFMETSEIFIDLIIGNGPVQIRKRKCYKIICVLRNILHGLSRWRSWRSQRKIYFREASRCTKNASSQRHTRQFR